MPPLCRLVICWGVRATDPEMGPDTAFEIVRSATAGPRTPAATALWRLALVAGETRPSKDPVMVRLVPLSVAETVPDPASAARVRASAGVAERRVLKVSLVWAASESASAAKS